MTSESIQRLALIVMAAIMLILASREVTRFWESMGKDLAKAAAKVNTLVSGK